MIVNELRRIEYTLSLKVILYKGTNDWKRKELPVMIELL